MSQEPTPIEASGEYGATTVEITRNGDAYRLAFGRYGAGGQKRMLGAVLLTAAAFKELKNAIVALDE